MMEVLWPHLRWQDDHRVLAGVLGQHQFKVRRARAQDDLVRLRGSRTPSEGFFVGNFVMWNQSFDFLLQTRLYVLPLAGGYICFKNG
jgi:hypothetical protein